MNTELVVAKPSILKSHFNVSQARKSCVILHIRSMSHDAGWIRCWGGMAWKFVKAGKRREGGGIKEGV